MRERLRLKECGMKKGSGYEESRTSVPSMQCIIIHTNQIISHQLSCFPEWYWKLFFVPRTLTIKYSSLIHYIEFHNRLSKKRMRQDLLFLLYFLPSWIVISFITPAVTQMNGRWVVLFTVPQSTGTWLGDRRVPSSRPTRVATPLVL